MLFENVGRSVVLLGGAAGLTLCLAGGVAVGVVPQAGGTSATSAAPAAEVVQEVGTAPSDTVAPTTVAPEAPAPETSTTSPRARARSGGGSEATVSAGEEESVGAAAEEAAGPAGPTTAARLNPSSAQVKAAIAQIGAGLPISEAQARQFGNEVCSAFDQGQSFSAVKATAQQAASQVPFVTVSPSQVDSAVRAAVQLFCPGYAAQI